MSPLQKILCKLVDCELTDCDSTCEQIADKIKEIQALIPDYYPAIIDSSLCHLCFAHVSECDKEAKELADTIKQKTMKAMQWKG